MRYKDRRRNVLKERLKAFLQDRFYTHTSRDHPLCTKADLVVASFDRPLQLYAFLESVERYVTGLEQVHVIYRVSNELYKSAYDQLKLRFSSVSFVLQGLEPYKDFKPLMMQAAFDSPADYILFAVDDIVVKDYICLKTDICLLHQYDAYGFFYRLGTNLSFCYTINSPQAVPVLTPCKQTGVYSWRFFQGTYDWAYPNNVDMTLFKKADIKKDLVSIPMESPTFEGAWADRMKAVMHRIGLCYETSKIVNLPLNKVQTVYNNRHQSISTDELLMLFNRGLKIDIDPLFGVHNTSAHMEYEPHYVSR